MASFSAILNTRTSRDVASMTAFVFGISRKTPIESRNEIKKRALLYWLTRSIPSQTHCYVWNGNLFIKLWRVCNTISREMIVALENEQLFCKHINVTFTHWNYDEEFVRLGITKFATISKGTNERKLGKRRLWCANYRKPFMKISIQNPGFNAGHWN